jgi:hypothetical protein
MRVHPSSNEMEQFYWMGAIKLHPQSLNEGPRKNSGKLRLNLPENYRLVLVFGRFIFIKMGLGFDFSFSL